MAAWMVALVRRGVEVAAWAAGSSEEAAESKVRGADSTVAGLEDWTAKARAVETLVVRARSVRMVFTSLEYNSVMEFQVRVVALVGWRRRTSWRT